MIIIIKKTNNNKGNCNSNDIKNGNNCNVSKLKFNISIIMIAIITSMF